jgi:hypothetical protein
MCVKGNWDEDWDELLSDDKYDDNATKPLGSDIDPNLPTENSFLPPPVETIAVTRHCDAIQIEAVKYIVARSRLLSDDAFPSLIHRVETMGFSLQELQNCILYIRDSAPIIVHLRLDQNDRLQSMVRDTHYRSQFETKMSNGTFQVRHTSRICWENRLFNNIYDGCKPFQRVKYGCLNIVKDPRGIVAANHYGDSYFVLKAVRLRCSFSAEDSANANCDLASCEYYNHVLNAYKDSELKLVLEVANGITPRHSSNALHTYKEVQVHGEIRFSDNIAALIVNKRHRGNANIITQVKQFCAVNNCAYDFTDNDTMDLSNFTNGCV